MTKEDSGYNLTRKLVFSDRALEKDFLDDYCINSLGTVRIAIILAMLLYAVFGLLDTIIAPSTRHSIWFIRYVIVIPTLSAVLISTWTSLYKKGMQIILSIASITMGIGITAMIAGARDRESILFYYAGLILVIFWSYAYVRLRFVYATAVCWFIVICYQISAIGFQDMLSSPKLAAVFISNNFFFISANVIGMFVAYSIESYTRRDFLQRLTIKEKNKILMSEKIQLQRRNKLIELDMKMARKIQQKLIPESSPLDAISFLFKPMEPVGGDFFDFITYDNKDSIGIFISDVSGHGTSAALITSMIKIILYNAGDLKEDPSKLMFHLNETLMNHIENNYITAFYGIFNFSQRTINYVNAGHPYPILLNDKSINQLDTCRGFPLAMVDNSFISKSERSYSNTVTTLPEKSKLILLTDGVLEASPEINMKNIFAYHIDQILEGMAALKSKDLIPSLYRRLVEFNKSDNFNDDICIISMDIE